MQKKCYQEGYFYQRVTNSVSDERSIIPYQSPISLALFGVDAPLACDKPLAYLVADTRYRSSL